MAFAHAQCKKKPLISLKPIPILNIHLLVYPWVGICQAALGKRRRVSPLTNQLESPLVEELMTMILVQLGVLKEVGENM